MNWSSEERNYAEGRRISIGDRDASLIWTLPCAHRMNSTRSDTRVTLAHRVMELIRNNSNNNNRGQTSFVVVREINGRWIVKFKQDVHRHTNRLL